MHIQLLIIKKFWIKKRQFLLLHLYFRSYFSSIIDMLYFYGISEMEYKIIMKLLCYLKVNIDFLKV